MNVVLLISEMTTATQTTIPHPAREELELADVLHALSDPVRLRIVSGARRGRRPVVRQLRRCR